MSNRNLGAEQHALHPHILLVEDDEELREALAENLRLNGLSVQEADCGAAFHEARRRAEFDIAIVDVNLPDANGFDLAASMANDVRRPGIIMLTARTGQEDRIRGYSEGADLYMTKPVAGEELVLAVRNLVRRIEAQWESAAAENRKWQLDVTMRRLIAPDGRFIDLSGREVLLIEQFLGHESKTLSRQMLSEVLGYGKPSPENRALDAALRRLRQKLDEVGLPQPLASVNNIGIRFSASLMSV